MKHEFTLTERVKDVPAGTYVVVQELSHTIWFVRKPRGFSSREGKRRGITKAAFKSAQERGLIV